MLRALTTRSTGARSLVFLQFGKEATRVVDPAYSVINEYNVLHRWFGTDEGGKPFMDTERYLFEEYVKEHRLSALADVLEKEMFQEELDDEQRQIPIRAGGFEYSFQCPGEYPALYRTPYAGHARLLQKQEEEEPELVLDTSELCAIANKKRIDLQALKISSQGNSLLILAHLDGVPHVFTRDLNRRRTILQDHIHGAMDVEYDMNDEIYFTRPDELGRPSKVYAAPYRTEEHGVTENHTSRLVFEDTDKRNFVGIQRTKDWKYICINSVSKTSSEVHLLDSETNKVVLVRAREAHCEYVVEHAHDHLLLVSNHEDVHENRLYVAKISRQGNHIQIAPWTPAPYRLNKEDAFLSDVTVHASACTLLEKLPNGLPRIRVLPFSLQSGNILSFDNHYDVPLPEWTLDVQFGSNEEFTSDRVELELQSPILPPIFLDWDLKSRQIFCQSSLDHAEINLQQYTAIRVPLQSSQGHAIPLTLTYRNDAQNPSKCLFVVYGAYGENLDMAYQSHMFPLLQRGWKIVYVHVRGGGENGRAWYHAGRVPHKINSEIDLYECIKQLIDKGVASFGKSAIMTYSAGAIPVCGVLNMHPNIGIKAVIMDSPFVDVLDSMSDSDHPLTEHEHDEFGDPSDEKSRAHIARFCPTASLQDHDYPSMLLTTGNSDEHINVQGVGKYISSVREKNTQTESSMLFWPGAFQHHLPQGNEMTSIRALQFAFIEHVCN